MIIQGRREDYNCTWESYGWSYAAVRIEAIRVWKLFFFIPIKWIKRWKTVGYETIGMPGSSSSSAMLYNTAKKLGPNEIKEWFEHAVKSHEDYLGAWEGQEKISARS